MLCTVEDKDIEIISVNKSEKFKSNCSSQGNQLKWLSKGRVIKKDCLGYECVAEVMVSFLMNYIKPMGFEYVEYKPCIIYEEGTYIGRGCYSEDFRNGNEEISISQLLQDNLVSFNLSYDDLREFLFQQIGYDTKRYLDFILCLDSITRNEDRHYGNISFLADGNILKPAPVFDNGAACMSDCISYPLSGDFNEMIKHVYAKPFNTRFKNQLQFVERLVIDYDGFLQNVNIDKTDIEGQRALKTVLYGLREMEGIAWVRC